MPFVTARAIFNYGTATYRVDPSTYCQHDTSASDFGRCYNIVAGRAVFVQTNTATYPSLPCEADNTCIRYTSTTWERVIMTIFNYPNRQAILQHFNVRSHSRTPHMGRILHLYGLPVPTPSGLDPAYLWFMPSHNYEITSWPLYDPLINYKAYLNPYSIPVGNVNILRWQGNIFTSSATLSVYEGNLNNMWYAFDGTVVWGYESSPLAIVPLDYDSEYAVHRELRNVFGYAVTGVDQPGWNADDIIRVLRELFPNKAWAVYDDKAYTLFLYNITPDFVSDWLINHLLPVKIKVLKRPHDASAAEAWLEELNRRNAYNTPPAEPT